MPILATPDGRITYLVAHDVPTTNDGPSRAMHIQRDQIEFLRLISCLMVHNGKKIPTDLERRYGPEPYARFRAKLPSGGHDEHLQEAMTNAAKRLLWEQDISAPEAYTSDLDAV